MKKILLSGLLAFYALATISQTTIYSTGFGSVACSLPAGWSVENDGTGNEIFTSDLSASDGGFSGECNITCRNEDFGASAEQRLILSGQVNTTGYSAITVSWASRITTDDPGSFPAPVTVEYNAGSGWTAIQAWTDVGATWALVNGGVPVAVDATNEAEGIANLQFRFRYTDNGTGDTLFIDDFFVRGCLEPSTSASASGATLLTPGQFLLSWTIGDGSDRIVVVKQGGVVDGPPVDGTAYTANADFTLGQDIGGGNIVVYSGSGSNVTITGLSAGTQYYWAIYEYENCVSPVFNYKTTAPETGNATTCTTPTTHASVSSASLQTTTTFQLDWTPGNGDNRIVVLKAGGAVDATPSDGTTYTANADFTLGENMGAGNIVVYNGPGTTVSITGLTWGTTYYWKIFEYKNCGPTYYTGGTPESGSTSTTCPEPTTDATPSTSNILSSSFQLDWVNGGDPGSNHLVVVKQGALPFSVFPSDGVSYTANSDFTLGQDLGSGNIAVYNSTGLTVTITNLSPGTEYSYAVYEFNDCNPNYLSPTTAVGSITTTCDEPTQASVTASSGVIGTNQFNISWTNGNGTNRLVVVSTVGAVTATPSDASSYTASSAAPFGDDIGTSEFVAYNGTGNNVTITGLTPGTTYYWAVFEFNDCQPNYNITAPATNSETTCTTPTTHASVSSASLQTTTTFQLDWTPGNGDNRIVVLKAGSAVDATPSDGTTYTANADFTLGEDMGTGNIVVYNGAGTTVSISGLTWGTTYFWKIFEYNNCGPTYYTGGTPESGSTTTDCPQPTNEVASTSTNNAYNNDSTKTTSFQLDWVNGASPGTNHLVVVKQGTAVDGPPVDGVSYTANPVFMSGTQIGTGNYVVYGGTGNTETITGLSKGTEYFYAVYDFNDCEPDYKIDAFGSGSFYTACDEPTSNPTSSSAGSLATTQFNISWVGGNGDKSIVVVKAGGAVDVFPADLGLYSDDPDIAVGQNIGSGNIVVYNGSGSNVTITNLTPGTTYNWAVMEFNDCEPDYYLTSPSTGSATTCTTPTVAVSGSNVTGATSSTFNLNWVNGGADGDNRIVVMKANGIVAADPANGNTYTANAAFGSGQTIAANEYVVYSGTGSTVPITNITWNNTYYWEIFENKTCGPTYLTSPTETGSICAEPSTDASGSSAGSITGTSFTLSWTSGNGTNRLVVLKKGSAVSASPVDLSSYTANSVFETPAADMGGGNYAVYNGAGTSVNITGLEAGATTYYWAIFEYNSCGPNYKTDAPATGNATTLNYYYSNAAGSATLNLLTSWGKKADGSGSNPADFTSAGQTFFISNTTTASTGGAWTVSGAGSRIKVPSTVTIGFTISSGGAVTGTIDVASSAKLIIDNASNPTIDTLGTTSTVEYSTNSASVITRTYEGNLTISKALALSGSIQVNGALTLNNPLTIGANTLTLNGTITGASTLTGSATSNISIGGTGAFGTLSLDQTGLNNNLQNLTINRTTSGTVTLGSRMDIVGLMTLTNGNLVLNNQNLVFNNGSISQASGRITGNYASTSQIIISGSGAFGTISFDQSSAPSTRTIQKIENSRAGVTVTLGTALNLKGDASGMSLTTATSYLAIGANTLTIDTGSGFSGSGFITGSASSNIIILGTSGTSPGTLYMNQSTGTTKSLNLFRMIRSSQTLTLGNDINATTFQVQAGTVANGGNAIAAQGSGTSISVSNGATLDLSGTSTFPTGFTTTTLNNTSTVYYSGTDQDVAGKSYAHLIISGSGTKTLLAPIASMVGNFTISAGTFDDGGNLVSGTVAAHTINMAASTFYLCGATNFLTNFTVFTLNATSTVDYNRAGAASVKGVTYGNLTISGSGTKTLLTPGISNMAGTFTISSGTFADGGFTVDGTGSNTINMAAGTFFLCSATDFLTQFGTYTLNATSTVNYNKAGDSNVRGGITYGHLIYSGSGIKTLQAAITNMAGNFTGSGGTFDNNTYNVDGVGTKTFQLDAGATFLSRITPGEAFPTDFASYTMDAASTFEYGAAGAQTIQNLDPNSSAINYGNVTVSGSGTKTLSVNLTNPISNFTINTGTFDNGGFTFNVDAGSALTMAAGTFYILGGTSSMPAFSSHSLNATSTVNYAGTNQSVAGMTYGHLTISGSGTKTLLADISNMAGTLTLSAGTFDDDGNLVDGTGANTINIAASAIYLCGATDFLSDFGTFTLDPTSTVNYNKLGDANVRGIPYGNLIISGSGTKTLIAAISNITGTFTISAGTFNDGGFVVDGTGANTIDMAAATTYLCSAANFLTDFGTFTLAPTSTVNYNGGSTNVRGSITYGNLTASGTGTKTLLTNISNMAGNFTVNAGIFDNAGNSVDGNTFTTFQIDAGATYITKITPGNAFPTDFALYTLDPTSNFEYGALGAQNVDDVGGLIDYGNIIISGTGTKTLLSSLTNPISNLTINGGTFNNGGFDIAVDALKTLSMAAATTFILDGTSSMPGFAFNSLNATSTVNYSGTTQNVAGLTYGNLTISGSLTKTLASNITNMAGTFTINSGTFDDGGYSVDGTGANTLAMAAATFFICKATDFLSDFGTFSLNPTSTVNYNRAGDANVRGITYGNLVISGSGIKTLQAAISNMTGTFDLTAGTFNDGGYTVDGTGLNTINAAAGTFYLCGATDFLSDFGTFSLNATSTVNYNRAGNGNVRGSITYGHLISSGSGVKTLQANITDMAGNFTVSAGTFDNNGNTLDGNATGKIFSADASATFITKVTPGGFPTGFGTYTLDATSTFEYDATGAQNVDFQSDIPSAVDYGNIIISGSGTKTLLGNLTSNISDLTINAGTFDNAGFTIAVAASKALTMSAGTFFLLGGTTAMPGFTTNSLNATSTVNYYGTAQNVAGLTYGNLTISGSGTKTLQAAISNMAGTLTVSNGTFDDGGFVVDGTGANTISMAASTIYLCGTTDFLTQFGTFSLDATSTVNYTRLGSANVRGIPYGNLIISGSGTKTLQAAIVGMAGTFTITAGTFDDGDFAVTGTGANSLVMDASTFYLCGVTNFVTGFTGFTLDASSTVDYNRAGAANVRGIAYGNLTISGSGTKTLQAAISNMQGTMTISAGTFDDGDFAVDGTGANVINMAASTTYLCGVTDFLSDFGTFTLNASSTVNYDKAGAANVRGGIGITYGNVIISGSGTKTLQAAIANMAGTFTVSAGTFDDGNFTVDGTGANTITMAAATFYLCGATDFLTDFGTFTLDATSTVDYDGADANVRGIPYGYLTLSGTGTKTLAASASAASDYSVTGVNVDMATYNLGVTGNYSNSGSVTYSNAGNLNVTGNFSNSAAASLNLGSTTFNLTGNLTNNGGPDATINTGTSGINISGNWTNSGTDALGGSGTISFDGIGTQTVAGTTDFTGTPAIINNSGGGKVQLAASGNTFGNLTINATGILDPVANDFNVAGNWTNDRGVAGFTPITTQKVTFIGDAARIIGGTGSTKFRDITCNLGPAAARTLTFNTACNIERVLDVNDGQVVANGNITLVSNASGTAAVGNLSDGSPEATAISGNVICQRFINESPSGKWHLLAGQSTGGTLQDWNDDIWYTGSTFVGADNQSVAFVNVLTYNETTNDAVTTGFIGATNVTNALNNGSTYSGFFVYDQFVSEVVDITGPVRSDAASISFPLSYTSIPNEFDGYNLFGNPHPCAVDWESVRNNGATTIGSVNITMSYMTPSGSYGFLTDDGVPSGDKLIASGEGFWVRATGGGNVVIQETDKVPTGTDPYQNKISGGPLVGLNVTLKQGTYKDSPATFYFRDSHLGLPVTAGIDPLLDCKKGHTNTLKKENIAAVIENENVAVNFLPDSISQIDIPLRVWKQDPANVSKVYTLEFSNVAILKNENKCFIFEDTYAGVSFPLTNDTSYSVTMKDTTFVPRFFLHTSTPIQSTVKDVFCANGTEGFITANGSGSGPFNYIWKNQAGDTLRNVSSSVADTLNGIGAGFYYLTVSNNGACGTVGNSFEIKALNPFDMTLSKTDLTCYGDSAGTALITTNGGSGNFSYLWSNGDTLAQATNLKSQVYFVTVTDSLGCAQVDSATISQPAEIAVNPTAMNIACFGDSNGTALTFASGGNSPYTYLWSTGSGQSQISNLKSQVYYVTVTDNSGCSKPDSVSIIQPDELILSNASVDVACYGESTGEASVLVSGGTSDYTYSWSSGGNTETEPGVIAGSYSVTVTDANNCIKSASFTVGQPALLSITATSADVSCYGGNDGNAAVIASGGTSGYTYSWSSGGTDVSETGLSAGTYTIVVTDNNNCQKTSSVTINEPDSISISGSFSDATCGNNNGSVSVSATGGTGTLEYLWNTGDQTQSISSLATGTYSVTVSDAGNCSNTSVLMVNNINGPSVSIASSVDVDCYGENTGEASVNTSGGTSPFTYLWNNGDQTQTASSLIAGTYFVSVTDDNNCVGITSIEILEPSAITATTTMVEVSCNGNSDGEATVIASGGVSGYSFNWSSGGTLDTETGLGAGTYSVTVTDNNNCQKTSSVTINEPDSIAITASSSDATCGNNNGSASVSATGGTGTLAYLWNTGDQTQSISSLGTGTYSVIVTDANNCTKSSAIIVNNINGPSVSISSSVDVACHGGNTGEASVSTSGGTSPFTYLWDNGDQTQTASSLIAGTYFVSVTDDNNCVGITSIEILEPSVITATTTMVEVSCNGNNDGEATVIPSGGVPGYSFNWSSGGTLDVETGLSAGIYSVTITDSNNCTGNVSVIISQPDELLLSSTFTDTYCENDNGSADVSASGGTGGYSYSWSTGATDAFISGLSSGSYSALVTDANGCSKTDIVLISFIPGPVLDAPVVSDPTCYGLSDGEASLTVSGISPYTYLWQNSSGDTIQYSTNVLTSDLLQNVSAGIYSVFVLDNNGCGNTISVTLNQPDEVIAAFTTNADTVDLANGGTISLSNSSTGTNDYSWDFGDGNSSMLFEPSHSYTLEGTYIIILTAGVDPCTNSYQQTVEVINSVGIYETTGYSDVKIHFVGEKAIVEYNFSVPTNLEISLFNLLGQNTLPNQSFSVMSGELIIELPAATGIYFLKVRVGNKEQVRKVFR